MKIGQFEVGDYVVKDMGGKRHLVFDCKNCVYGASLAEDRACMFHVLHALQEVDADLIVFAEVYERVYDEHETKMLTEISALIRRLENDSLWSYAHLGTPTPDCEALFGARHDAVVRITHDMLAFDPVMAYLTCLHELKTETEKMGQMGDQLRECNTVYLSTLTDIKKRFESTEMIARAKDVLQKLQKVPESREIYRTMFEAEIKPSFIGSRLLFGDDEELELLDDYTIGEANVQIFKHPNKTENLYFVNPPEYTLSPEKYFILTKTKEIVASYKPGKTSLSTVAKSRKYFERIYESTIHDIAQATKIPLTNDEARELAGIVARYTVGYGVLELLLQDKHLTDIYIDAPIGMKPIYVVHSEFGQCQTNIVYTGDEAESLVSKLRAMSGRPFDEAHPVLDYDLADSDARIAVIGTPLSPDGNAFAFRLHKVTPWTLPQFVDNQFMTPLSAGLLSFFIDQQATMLITGSRGAGKTSLLQAVMLEILQNTRIIVQQDTLELPIEYMKNIGYNIQSLKTRSPISVSKTESEVSPEESLRTALRLGDSALVLGEVRSIEAKVLYEAMRVGAAGNVVLGTIHGDSAYSVWDRVVNDLEVPTTSFKATDLVVVCRPIRFRGSLRRHRRLTQVTEVKKHWTDDPDKEGGLLDLMHYNAKDDRIDLLEDNLKESDLFERIQETSF
jgi:type IV secretory pathway ATPase VirB11/archaellum biosynthesis ATPase